MRRERRRGSGPLEGVDWELSSLAGATGPSADTSPITARFERERSRQRWVQPVSRDISLDGADLQIGPVAATRMACDEPTNARETAYFAALEKVASYQADGASLTLLDGDGGDLLTYQKVEPTPLTGTEWTGLFFNDGDALVSALADSGFTAIFADDGTGERQLGVQHVLRAVHGRRRHYVLRAARVDPDGVRRGGHGPGGGAVRRALIRVTSFAIQGDELTLLDDQGNVQVSLPGLSRPHPGTEPAGGLRS